MSARKAPRRRRERERVVRGELLYRSLRGAPSLDYFLYVPRATRPRPELLVTVHGFAGNAREHARVFAPLAERRGVILLAPHFDRLSFADYQRLGRVHLGERADLALHRVLADVERLTGADARRLHLFGHSGGAQFVQRYAMAHPERVAGAVAASAGWYTFPDPNRVFPLGIRPTPRLPGVRFRSDRFLGIPMLVTVGNRDVGCDAALRRTRRLDLQQGENRLERAERFVEAMAEAARVKGLPPSVELRRLPGASHSFAESVARDGLAELALAFLFDRGESTAKAEDRRAG